MLGILEGVGVSGCMVGVLHCMDGKGDEMRGNNLRCIGYRWRWGIRIKVLTKEFDILLMSLGEIHRCGLHKNFMFQSLHQYLLHLNWRIKESIISIQKLPGFI